MSDLKIKTLRERFSEASGIEVSERTTQLIIEHLEHVIRENKKLNLTRIDSLEDGILLHIEDSLAGASLCAKHPAGPLADIGSGAGFPGIPLALASNRKTTLLESIQKKADAIKRFIKSEHLEELISVMPMRAEEVALTARGTYGVVTARALSTLPVLVELASPLLMIGGLLVAYKGQPENAELEAGQQAAAIVGLEEVEVVKTQLSDGSTNRTLIVYKKVAEPAIPLPRRNGVAQKRPLA